MSTPKNYRIVLWDGVWWPQNNNGGEGRWYGYNHMHEDHMHEAKRIEPITFATEAEAQRFITWEMANDNNEQPPPIDRPMPLRRP